MRFFTSIDLLLLLLLLLFSWPPVREMCTNYKVLMFRHRTGNPLDLVSVNSCYIAFLIIPGPPFPPATRCPPKGGVTAQAPSLSSCPTFVSPHMIIFPPRRHLYQYKHTKARFSLNQNLLPPCPPCPRHACRIPYAVPFLSPKSLLMLHSASSEPPFSATTAYGTPPLPCSPSIYIKPQVLSSTSPTLPLMTVACQ